MRTITVGAIVGLVLACALPLDGKDSCITSTDCVDARVCIDGQCHDGACEAWCSAVCDAADDCDQGPTSDCESRCIAGDASDVVPTLPGTTCRQLWDEWSEDDECHELACVLACTAACELARTECDLVFDESACFTGCITYNDSCSAIPTKCIDVPAEVVCWEAGRDCQ